MTYAKWKDEKSRQKTWSLQTGSSRYIIPDDFALFVD